MSEPLRVLDLFSGIGGFSLGLERAGMKTVAFCEVSPVCRHLLAHHWPEVPCYDDICTLSAERLAADGIGVDVICGGFPCQDLSLAGLGLGLSGARSGLFFEIVRLAREIKQRSGRLPILLLENVSALLGRGIGDVLGALAALGYDAWWDCIPASAVGAPHRRDRVWIVAYPGGVQHQGYGDAVRWAVCSELSSTHLANAEHGGIPERRGVEASGGRAGGRGRVSRDVPARSTVEAERQLGSDFSGAAQWVTEPAVGRVAHGVPARVDRLHGLGNAVVPQIPEILGRAILSARAA